VGKTYLVNVLIACIQHNFAIVPGTSPVLVCAPTGPAARNVRGQTIHSLLSIPVQPFTEYEPLQSYFLQMLRDTFKGVHTLVIKYGFSTAVNYY
jgi:hypothetical protein